MSYSAPNATPSYQSVAYPVTSRNLTVKRGDGSTAGGGTATTVGTYFAENCNITRPATVIDRKGIVGQMKGEPTIIRNPASWSSKLQIDATTSNTIRQGDYFEESIDVDAATVATTKVRFVISNVTKDETGGSPHTFDITAVEDQVHSTQYGGS